MVIKTQEIKNLLPIFVWCKTKGAKRKKERLLYQHIQRSDNKMFRLWNLYRRFADSTRGCYKQSPIIRYNKISLIRTLLIRVVPSKHGDQSCHSLQPMIIAMPSRYSCCHLQAQLGIKPCDYLLSEYAIVASVTAHYIAALLFPAHLSPWGLVLFGDRAALTLWQRTYMSVSWVKWCMNNSLQSDSISSNSTWCEQTFSPLWVRITKFELYNLMHA